MNPRTTVEELGKLVQVFHTPELTNEEWERYEAAREELKRRILLLFEQAAARLVPISVAEFDTPCTRDGQTVVRRRMILESGLKRADSSVQDLFEGEDSSVHQMVVIGVHATVTNMNGIVSYNEFAACDVITSFTAIYDSVPDGDDEVDHSHPLNNVTFLERTNWHYPVFADRGEDSDYYDGFVDQEREAQARERTRTRNWEQDISDLHGAVDWMAKKLGLSV